MAINPHQPSSFKQRGEGGGIQEKGTFARPLQHNKTKAVVAEVSSKQLGTTCLVGLIGEFRVFVVATLYRTL